MKIKQKLLILLILAFVLFKAIGFYQIDACLDAGGAWDYVKDMCNNDENSSIEEMQCLSAKGTYDKATNICSFE